MAVVMRNPTRRAEAYRDGLWHEVPFQDIKKYDVFKLYEHDGKPVIDKYKGDDGVAIESAVSVALGDAFLSNEGDLTVHCIPLPPDKN